MTTTNGTLLVLAGPIIESIVQEQGVVTLTWSTAIGQSYQVQSTTDLVVPAWTSLGDVIVATNTTTTAKDALGADPLRFYRISVQP